MKICGLDEVGRGALAGPLVAAGVCLPDLDLEVKDSKSLTRKKRERLFQEILELNAEIAIEVISVRQINRRGIGWANVEIFKRIIKRVNADKYIIDGNMPIRTRTQKGEIESLVRADQSIPSVMAASIVAKVTRDRLMQDLHRNFPQYGWDENCGYGTRSHISAIAKLGLVKHHRDLFVCTALRNSAKKAIFLPEVSLIPADLPESSPSGII